MTAKCDVKKEFVQKLIVENEHGKRFCMNNVIYSPELVKNLMHVRQLYSNGYKIVFGVEIEIIDRNNGNIILKNV